MSLAGSKKHVKPLTIDHHWLGVSCAGWLLQADRPLLQQIGQQAQVRSEHRWWAKLLAGRRCSSKVKGQRFDMLFGAGEAHGMTWRDRQSMAE